jgi:hypothetical protein
MPSPVQILELMPINTMSFRFSSPSGASTLRYSSKLIKEARNKTRKLSNASSNALRRRLLYANSEDTPRNCTRMTLLTSAAATMVLRRVDKDWNISGD